MHVVKASPQLPPNRPIVTDFSAAAGVADRAPATIARAVEFRKNLLILFSFAMSGTCSRTYCPANLRSGLAAS
jgi:hypothetical protein